MSTYLLKFSTLLILSQFVYLSHQLQSCLGTLKPGNIDYTFALAHVEDVRNPLAAQEACYYSCGAQVVTQSSNRGDMNRLTLMDNSATLLTRSGFLKVGESYLLNHLGLEDSEGGNGIGCIQVKPGNQIMHYPKTHPVCKMSKAAVCGFWGQQSIPTLPNGMQLSVSQPEKSIPVVSPTRAFSPPTATVAVVTTTRVIIPTIELEKNLSSLLNEPKKSTTMNAAAPRFSVNGRNFNVISRNTESMNEASVSCQTNQGDIANITTDNLEGISSTLKRLGQSKMIIGSWNGDNYSLIGNNCLIMHVDYGIYPGNCKEALSTLCQLL